MPLTKTTGALAEQPEAHFGDYPRHSSPECGGFPRLRSWSRHTKTSHGSGVYNEFESHSDKLLTETYLTAHSPSHSETSQNPEMTDALVHL